MKIVDKPLLATFAGPGRCEWCRKWVRSRDCHHLFSRGAGRLDIAINLIALCTVFSGGDNCHQLFHDGHILRDSLIAIVCHREGILKHELERQIYALRRAPKGSDVEKFLRVPESYLGIDSLRPNGKF